MARSRHRRFSLAAFARTSFGAALALVAVALQSFVIETHVDAQALRPAIEASANTVSTAATNPAHQHAPALCIICQAAAISGTAVLAAAPAVGPVEATLYLSSSPPREPLVEARPTL